MGEERRLGPGGEGAGGVKEMMGGEGLGWEGGQGEIKNRVRGRVGRG